MKKRRHHYVWRHYLEAWARDGVLACYQDGRTFLTSPENVGVKKDFYRLKELSDADLWFLQETIDRADAEPLKRMNRSWVPMFVKVFEIRELLEQDTQDPEVLAQVDVLIQNAEEELHSGIEAYAIRYLGLLRDEDLEFLESPEDLASFLHFFAVQFMRTLKGEEDVSRELLIGGGSSTSAPTVRAVTRERFPTERASMRSRAIAGRRHGSWDLTGLR